MEVGYQKRRDKGKKKKLREVKQAMERLNISYCLKGGKYGNRGFGKK